MKRLKLLFCALAIPTVLTGTSQNLAVAPATADTQVVIDQRHWRAPVVALTFDDGPRHATTSRLLDGLALREIPATFFVLGDSIEDNEELLQRMVREGHQIGFHSQSHVPLIELSRQDFDLEVTIPRAALKELLHLDEIWLRPPYGAMDESLLKREKGPIILWSLDPKDWEDRDVQRIVDTVLLEVQDGDILLLHDIYDSTVDATLMICDALLNLGYTFATVEQLMDYRTITPQAEDVYRNRLLP